MSLINKMLQDLDARRSELTADALGLPIRPVPAQPRSHVAWWVASAFGLGLVAVIGWELLGPAPLAHRSVVRGAITQAKKPAKAAANKPAAPATANNRADAATAAASQPPLTAPVAPAASVAQAAPSAVATVPPAQAPAAAAAPATNNGGLALSQSLTARPAAPAAEKPAPEATHARRAPAEDIVANVAKPSAAARRSAKAAPPVSEPELPKAAPVDKMAEAAPVARPAVPPVPANMNKQVKELTPQQRADNEYRKALSQIQQGLTTEATNGLELVLQLDPRHVAARQALIGLLLENRRQEDALRLARLGLSLDATQPGLAMIAARLQVEKGDLRPAIEVLEKTLPYASDRADYQSFLAALLQRDGRYKESVEHYLLALQKAPQNGVWWMGLGISFQADNRPAEAQEAFTRAKATNGLSPELLAFVESKLNQLRR